MKNRFNTRAVLCIIFAFLLVLSAAALLRGKIVTFLEEGKLASLSEEVTDQQSAGDGADGSTEILPQYAGLYGQNPDLGGWVRIDGTQIDYPVMFTPEDPEKYIHRNFDGEYSPLGLPFIGAGSSVMPRSDNLILYGHNMKSGKMFAGLLKYRDESYWKEHPSIYFSTLYEEGSYDIIAAFQTDLKSAESIRCYDFIEARDKADFDDFIAGIRSASLYDTGVDVVYGDELVTLSTCAYHTTDGRFVIVARKAPG